MNIHEHSNKRDWSIAARRVKNNFTINLPKRVNIFRYPYLGSTAHALLCYLPPGHYCACSPMHNKIFFFQRAAQLQTARCANARHVRTAHKLAADSTGASHRLAPVLSAASLWAVRTCLKLAQRAVCSCAARLKRTKKFYALGEHAQ